MKYLVSIETQRGTIVRTLQTRLRGGILLLLFFASSLIPAKYKQASKIDARAQDVEDTRRERSTEIC